MSTNKKDIYVLGTGLSHDGSACLLKNGKIAVAIEKERITRIKHDGFNDNEAINYCLQAENIDLNDISLVVQNANFGTFEFGNSFYHGERLFGPNFETPIITISHHLAHAYYALGTCPFESTSIFVLDGCGNTYDECVDLTGGKILPDKIEPELKHLYAEKDSFYLYENKQTKTVFKDFSPLGMGLKNYPMHPYITKHSIGGVYSAATVYCFGDDSDFGKLMGLAPFGSPGVYKDQIFDLKDGCVYTNYDWMYKFNKPATSYDEFKNNFQYYADVAYWVQKQTEIAIMYLLKSRKQLVETKNIAFTGGVALNAVANTLLIKENIFENTYITPAAGDNGLSIGCAYYGWLEILNKNRYKHKGNYNFGKTYNNNSIENEIKSFKLHNKEVVKDFIDCFFSNINNLIEIKNNKQKFVIKFNVIDFRSFFLKINLGEIKLISDSNNFDCSVTCNSMFLSKFLKGNFTLLNHVDVNESLTVQGDIDVFLETLNYSKIINYAVEFFKDKKEFEEVKYKKEKNILKKGADLLSEGKIIGWYQSGCEFGPRALGYRSILADPRIHNVQNIINSSIKFREDFRPFAPAVIKEDVSNYFHYEGDSPYMLLTAQVKDHWKTKLKGIVHIDGSARIQTVSRDLNKKFYELIQEFKRNTGISVLLNTSLNRKGMPIVETPGDAISFFYECNLDVLVIGDFIITK